MSGWVWALAGLVVGAVGAWVKAALAIRAKTNEELRARRLELYPGLWRLTAAFSYWPPVELRRAELKQLLSAHIELVDPGAPLDRGAYDALAATASALRTGMTEDLAAGTRCVLGDMGYDADWVRQELLLRGVLPVIPPNPVRKEPVPLDRGLYRLRNRVERLVNKLKQFRAVATRYDKTAESFLAFVHLAAAHVWLRFVHTA